VRERRHKLHKKSRRRFRSNSQHIPIRALDASWLAPCRPQMKSSIVSKHWRQISLVKGPCFCGVLLTSLMWPLQTKTQMQWFRHISCVHIYMHTYMYIHIFLHVCVYIYLQTCTYICVCMCICILLYIHIYIHVFVGTLKTKKKSSIIFTDLYSSLATARTKHCGKMQLLYTFPHKWVLYIHIYVYMHIYIHTCIHIHKHVYMYVITIAVYLPAPVSLW